MPEALHEKLLELENELTTLNDIRQQMEENGKRSSAVLNGASESLSKAASILGQIEKLTKSIEELVERTDDVDFLSWLNKLDEALRIGQNTIASELKNTSLAVTKTIQDEYSVIRADQKGAQERFQEKLETNQNEMSELIRALQKSIKSEISEQHYAINTLHQDFMAASEGQSKRLTIIMVLVALALIVGGVGVALQFLQ